MGSGDDNCGICPVANALMGSDGDDNEICPVANSLLDSGDNDCGICSVANSLLDSGDNDGGICSVANSVLDSGDNNGGICSVANSPLDDTGIYPFCASLVVTEGISYSIINTCACTGSMWSGSFSLAPYQALNANDVPCGSFEQVCERPFDTPDNHTIFCLQASL